MVHRARVFDEPIPVLSIRVDFDLLAGPFPRDESGPVRGEKSS